MRMDDAKPFASLSPRLLARKGAAKPAMRQHLSGQFPGQVASAGWPGADSADEPFDEQRDAAHDDLGWNDMGEELAPEHEIAGADANVLHLMPPAVIRQREGLAAALADPGTDPGADPGADPGTVVRRSALEDGRRAAFTLRVDAERHLRLRMACAVKNRSAQQLVTEALDRVLAEVNGLDDLTRRARRTRQH